MEPLEIGKIEIEFYRTLVPSADKAKVIITGQQVYHINVRHNGNFDSYGKRFIPEILKNPDAIRADKKHPENTVILLKSFQIEDKTLRFYLVLRLHTPQDNPDYCNSIISFWYIHKKEYDRLMNG